MRFGHRVEAFLWLVRPAMLIDSIFYATAGWYVGFGRFDARLLLVCASVWVIRGGCMALNDVLDYPKDKVTAPDMPLPAGLISVRAATAYGALLILAGIVLGAVAGVDAGARVGVVAAYVVGLGLVVLYSQIKAAGFLASLVISIQISLPGVIGWIAGGGRDSGQFALVFAALTLFGVRGNLIAGLRDFDSDPEVGNRTSSVRLGLVRSVEWVLKMAALTAVLLGGVSVARSNWLGVAFCVIAVAVPIGAMPSMRRRFAADEERTRRSRSGDLSVLAGCCYWTAVAFPLSVAPVAGAVCYVVHKILITLVRPAYNRRLVDGGLVRAAREHARV